MKNLRRGLQELKLIFNDVIQNHEFDYDKVESIELDSDKKVFAKDEEQLRDYWRKYLKYDIVQKFTRKKNGQEDKLAAEIQYNKNVEAGLADPEEEKDRKPVKEKTDDGVVKRSKRRVERKL